MGLVLITAYTLAAVLATVLADARLQDAVGDGPRATVTSVAGVAMEILAVATYLLYGLIAERYGTSAALAVAGGLTAALALPSLRAAPRRRGAVASRP